VSTAHGLVIGKFYPPHAGHHLLVRTARALCPRVTVVVMASSVESIPLERRVAWMQAVHPDVHVAGVMDEHRIDYEDDAIWEAHVACIREGLADRGPVDVLVTAEDYGGELARRLGARHARVDVGRELVPMSGTAVRADPVAAWEHLAPPVRAGLAKRVVIVGAESTGKSTLAREVTDVLRGRGGGLGECRSVAEYGREYTVDAVALARARAALDGLPMAGIEDLAWPSAAFVAIAREQNRREDAAAALGGPVLVCDTDAFATGVWHERYVGTRSAEVEALARDPALYLLTHHDDVPFVQDGVRDGEAIRAWMTGEFEVRLAGKRWQWVRGERRERVAAAVAAIDGLLAEGWKLADPLG
jgi:HTH-type transcriptional repressor of NAD biosynthesis genes